MPEGGARPLSEADLARIRSVAFVRGPRGPRVREDDGRRIRRTLDEAGNVVVDRADGGRDVEIRPATIRIGATMTGASRPPAAGPRIDPAVHSAAPCRRCGNARGSHTGGRCP